MMMVTIECNQDAIRRKSSWWKIQVKGDKEGTIRTFHLEGGLPRLCCLLWGNWAAHAARLIPSCDRAGEHRCEGPLLLRK